MAMTFGKGNRSIAFNPTSAFPLDARSYFESYADAVAAAASAESAGSTNTQYYYGQTLVVVEAGKASFYIIQPNNTLSPVASGESSGGESGGATLEVNANQFTFDDNGALILRGSKAASPNSLVSIDANGVLHWVDPIDTYTKTEIDEKIAASAHLKRKVVDSVEEIEAYKAVNNDADQYVFMVPTGLTEDANRYDEYIVITIVDSDNISTQIIEKVGSWEVNLDDYVKEDELETALAGKVNVDENARLITLDEADKLSRINENAQENVIETVSQDFDIVTNPDSGLVKQLQLRQLEIAKINGLQAELNKKVDSIDGYTLLSPTDKDKLDALQLNGGNLEISGTVSASQIQGLAEWITEHQSEVDGLSENNLSDGLYTKLAQMLLIKSVDTNQMKVTAGKLSIVGLEQSAVAGLTDALNAKAAASDVAQLQSSVSTLETTVTNAANAVSALNTRVNNFQSVLNQHTADIAELKDSLTWKDI